MPCVINSELVKKHVTAEKDPWGLEYTKQNTAGSGAYKVTQLDRQAPQVVLERNDGWTGGPLPKVKRVIWRMVPSAGNRRALLERGDADISYDLPNKDFVELKGAGKLTDRVDPLHRTSIQYIGMNVTNPPFDNLQVRQAVACAIPYQKIMDAVVFGLGKPLFGAPADYRTEVALAAAAQVCRPIIAKAKTADGRGAGYLGFETTLSVRPRLRRRQRADLRVTQESLAQDRHQDHHQQGAGHQPGAPKPTRRCMPLYTNVVLGLARLSGAISSSLVLPRQEFDLQHDELPV